MVKNIRDALAKADPANAATYQANADAYLTQLQELDAWVFAQVKAVPEARRKLVTTHDTFGYFAARYGFEVVGTILPTSTEGASPSAKELAALIEAVKAQGVPAVFAENVSSNALLNQVAAEAGVKVVASLYTDALGPSGSEGETYEKMVRYNVTTIVNALLP
jgi:ABC-type Zn uptake system ZnuABC Zn-binding protein ZnuA